MKRAWLVFATVSAVLGALFLAACGGSGDSSSTSATATQAASASSPGDDVRSGQPPTRLVVKNLEQGKGAALPPVDQKPRMTMTLLYRAVDYKTGKVYERHENPRHPAKIEYGPALGKGLERGLAGMRVGGRRELIVPESMMEERPASIYVVELLRMKKNGTKVYARELKQDLLMSKREIAKLPPLTVPRRSAPPPKHIEVIDLRKGTGATVTKRDSVYVRFFEVAYPEVQKKSRTGGYPARSFGLNETVKGWRVGLPGMKVGGRRELILPPKLVYPRWKPSWGYTPYVNIYVIDLLGVKPSKDLTGDYEAELARDSLPKYP
jgi:peptidylprolyl isomerase